MTISRKKSAKKTLLPRREPREWAFFLPEEGESFSVRIRRFYDNPKVMMMEVFPGGGVEFRIPWSMPRGDAEKFVLHKREWIRKNRLKCLGLPSPPLCRYEEGEVHPYLGILYPLELSPGSRNDAVFRGGKLCLSLPSPERPEKVQQLLWKFYRQEAARLCEFYFHKHISSFESWKIKKRVQIGIRRLTGSWGRCSSKSRRISLNLFLAACPEICLEKVVVHELCHLSEPNHGPAFYALLETILPDWRERRKLLREVSLSAISRKYPQ